MIISDSHEFVFIHNPKVAGTSLRNALMKYSTHQNNYWGPFFSSKLQRTVDLAHIRADDVWAFTELRDAMDSYATIGLIRDPVDRFMSAVRYYNQRKPRKKRTVKQFIELFQEFPMLMHYDMDFVHFCPQSDFFYDNSAGYATSVADFVVDIMNIDNVSSILGLPLEIGRDNITDDSDEKQLSTDEEEDIRMLYKEDYRLLQL